MKIPSKKSIPNAAIPSELMSTSPPFMWLHDTHMAVNSLNLFYIFNTPKVNQKIPKNLIIGSNKWVYSVL